MNKIQLIQVRVNRWDSFDDIGKSGYTQQELFIS
jgi:hypothetical protein